LGCWQAGPPSCLRPGCHRAISYRAVLRTVLICGGSGPCTKGRRAGPALSTMYDRARAVPRAATSTDTFGNYSIRLSPTGTGALQERTRRSRGKREGASVRARGSCCARICSPGLGGSAEQARRPGSLVPCVNPFLAATKEKARRTGSDGDWEGQKNRCLE
jgi:hypothetical protein